MNMLYELARSTNGSVNKNICYFVKIEKWQVRREGLCSCEYPTEKDKISQFGASWQ